MKMTRFSESQILAVLRQVPGCKHLSGVTDRWCAQMGIPRGEPQQVVGLRRPL